MADDDRRLLGCSPVALGLLTALPLLYLGGFIPLFFFLQDSPNPPVGRAAEHVLFVMAGFAMALYFIDQLLYLVHVVARYRGSTARKVGWLAAVIVLAPIAMVVYWFLNVREPRGSSQ